MKADILLDTNILIYVAKGHEIAKKYQPHISGKRLAVSIITVGELFFGCYRSSQVEANIKFWESVLKGIEVIVPDFETCYKFACTKAALKESGKMIDDHDLWIAATALRQNCTLVSHNYSHFSRINGLDLISEG
jgi:tRNA(fMet)-specific endonuclease VapC